MTVAVAGALVLTGGGVAAAGGHLPLAFTSAFASWAEDWSMNGVHGVDSDTAERVATAPGPDGTTFTVMAAPSTTLDGADAACTVVVLERAGSLRSAGPSEFLDVLDSGCAPGLQGQPFGVASVSLVRADDAPEWTSQDLYVWTAAAGHAATAEVITADGRRWPAVSYDGTLYGWIPAPREGTALPQLIGYAADGSEVGRSDL
ncbi:hypothetical protein [Quadrisphaera granulorum]|uniref:hypothetical protein n=1 Tax=Quadrisphaera granulorum TaxID=317664 RepID=UPI000D6BA90B|nr:hypothetical protein [Quadrisphaera granulorum]